MFNLYKSQHFAYLITLKDRQTFPITFRLNSPPAVVLLRGRDAARKTYNQGSLMQNIFIDVFIWWFFFLILFLNNSSKLCTKRFGQQQPVLCWISHINSSQWRHTQLQDFKTSERSWTGDHDTKWWWLMFSIALPVFFPSKAHDTVGPPEEKTQKQSYQWNKTREKKQWHHKSAWPNSY